MAERPPLDVLVVCTRGQDVEEVRRLTAHWPVNARVMWAGNPVDALQRAMGQPPALVIVDARIDRAGGRALAHQFKRWREDMEVFVFEELADQPRLASSWRWRELPAVLDWWARRHLPAAGRARLPHSSLAAAPAA